MALFNRFPYSNAHELNLDWILEQLKNLHITQDDIQMVMDIAANFSGNVWPTVKSYGAVGDGITDDSQAIIDCMDHNAIVIFPEGQYYLGSQIEEVSRQNKVWIGWPRATIICTDFRPGFDSASNFMVQNLDFVGSQTGTPDALLTFYRSDNITVQNCTFNTSKTLGLEFATCGVVQVDHCEITGTKANCGLSFSLDPVYDGTTYGILSDRSVRSCYLHDNGLDGIIANNHNIAISDCIIVDNGLTTPAGGIYANSKKHLRISNCILRHNLGNGVDLVKCEDVQIMNCYAVSNDCAGFFMGGCNIVTVTGCTAEDNGSNPIDAWQDSGFVCNVFEGIYCSNIFLQSCAAISNRNYGYRFENVTNAMVSMDYANGNTLGARNITGNIKEADFSTV